MRYRPFLFVATFLAPLLAPTESLAQAHTKGRQVAPFTESLKPGDYGWHPELSQTGPVVIVASIPDQTLYVFRNGVRIGHSTISTGKSGKSTPTGVFTVLQKKVRHTSTIYKGAQMPHMQRLTWSGIALHAGHLPGYPASAGCVRMPVDFAANLYSVTDLGTTVIIADNDSAPKHTLEPGLLFSGKTGTDPTKNSIWDPAKAPNGPVSVIVSTADSKIYVYRNGVEIGRAPASGLNSVKLAGTFVYSADTNMDSTGRLDWISVASIGKKPPKLKTFEDHFLVDRSFSPRRTGCYKARNDFDPYGYASEPGNYEWPWVQHSGGERELRRVPGSIPPRFPRQGSLLPYYQQHNYGLQKQVPLSDGPILRLRPVCARPHE